MESTTIPPLLIAIIEQGVTAERKDEDIIDIAERFTDGDIDTNTIRGLVREVKERSLPAEFIAREARVTGVYMEPVQSYDDTITVMVDRAFSDTLNAGKALHVSLDANNDERQRLQILAGLEWNVYDNEGAEYYLPFYDIDMTIESLSFV